MAETRPDLSLEVAKAHLTVRAKSESLKPKRELRTKTYDGQPGVNTQAEAAPDIDSPERAEKILRLNQLAKNIRHEGSGVLVGRIPNDWVSSNYQGPRLVLGKNNPGIDVTPAGGFAYGRETQSHEMDSLARSLLHVNTPGELTGTIKQRAELAEFGLHADNIDGSYFLTTAKQGPYHCGLQLEAFRPYKDPRPFNKVTLSIVAPNQMSNELCGLLYTNPDLAPEVFKSFYPDVIDILPLNGSTTTKMPVPETKNLYVRNLSQGEPKAIHKAPSKGETVWHKIILP